jgi:hypothetical protein
MKTSIQTGTAKLADSATRAIAEYRFARDNSETKFLDWRPLPEDIAVLPELTLGGVQIAGNGAGWPAAEESQSLQYGEKKAANECEWRRAA